LNLSTQKNLRGNEDVITEPHFKTIKEVRLNAQEIIECKIGIAISKNQFEEAFQKLKYEDSLYPDNDCASTRWEIVVRRVKRMRPSEALECFKRLS
jgi:hypothetical protein